jgi:hypothetical protein
MPFNSRSTIVNLPTNAANERCQRTLPTDAKGKFGFRLPDAVASAVCSRP